MSRKLTKLGPRRKINWKDYNLLVDRVEILSNIRGSGGTDVSKTAFGVIVNSPQVVAAETTGLEISGASRIAICAENAPHQNRIIASINDTTTGITATSGDDFEVSVYCLITNGTFLDLASPRLKLDSEIEVQEHIFDSAGPVTRWTASGFQGTRAFTPRT